METEPKNKLKKLSTTNEETFPKYLMATSTDEHKSLHKVNHFKLANAIDSAANGKIVNITKLSNNFLLLETNSEKQSQAL